MLVSWSSAYCLPVEPSVATRMIEADPIIIPSMVSMNRVLLARKLSTASLTTSLNIMVERALASVRSKEVDLARFVVAITLTIRRLLVSQRCTFGAIAGGGGMCEQLTAVFEKPLSSLRGFEPSTSQVIDRCCVPLVRSTPICAWSPNPYKIRENQVFSVVGTLPETRRACCRSDA